MQTKKVNHRWVVFSLFCLILIAALQWSWQLSPLIAIATLIILIAVSWFTIQSTKHEFPATTESAAERFLSRNTARSVGLKLQGLGKLNMAFEKFKQCPHNHDSANLLYNLATDFQVKGEPENAKQVLLYITTFAPNFKDIKQHLQTFEKVPAIYTKQQIETNQVSQKTRTQSDSIKALTGVAAFEKTHVANHADTLAVEGIIDYPQLYGSRYKILNLLGAGTSGAVFKGRDIAADRLVAIKVLNLSAELDPSQLEEYKFRFHREVDTAGKLDHPNIIKIYDNGETDGFAYIAMEYVDGINLRNYARADKLLHPKTILKLIAQCADALAYAHKHNVIHRDIKPANILYNQTDDYLKLTDFGIARISDSTRTLAGSILGTPLYMSPEQLAGEKLDARSDLYSLGVTLYYLLTGSPPFRPKTMAELLRSISQERHKDIAEINPDTPACIAWTVNKALEKDPDKRFQSAASMANKLRECQMMLDG